MTSLTHILKVLDEHNIKYYDDGTNLVLSTCPFCEKDNKLNIAKDTGIYICWSTSCPSREGGKDHQNFENFEKRLAGAGEEEEEEVEEAIPQDLQPMIDRLWNEYPDILEYLHSRGISDDTIRYANLGANTKGHLVFPHIENGEIKRLKIRNMNYDAEIANYSKLLETNSKKELKEKGINKPIKWYGRGTDTLVNAKVLDNKIPWVMVLEGMTDTLTAQEMGIEYYVGSPSASFKQDNWIEKFDNAEIVYICMDNDKAGQSYARDLAERIGMEKCYNIELPCNDLSDLWTTFENPIEVLNECIDNAKQFDVDFVSASSVFEAEIEEYIRGLDDDGLSGFKSGYDKIDSSLGGWRTGELTLFVGMPKIGKTTLLKTMSYGIAKQGTPVYYMSFETRARRLVMDLASYSVGKKAEDMGVNEFKNVIADLDSIPIYWYLQKGKKRLDGIEALEDLFRQAKQRYGIKFIVLDNLSKLTNAIGSQYRKKQENEESILQDIGDMAQRLDVHIVLVHHIKKESWGNLTKDKMPSLADVKGSSELVYAPDNIMVFHRLADKNLPKQVTSKAKVVFDAIRDGGESSIIDLKYDHELRYYSEI